METLGYSTPVSIGVWLLSPGEFLVSEVPPRLSGTEVLKLALVGKFDPSPAIKPTLWPMLVGRCAVESREVERMGGVGRAGAEGVRGVDAPRKLSGSGGYC